MLHNGLHSMLLKMATHCLSGYWLCADILQLLVDIHSCISFSRADKALRIVDGGGRKLGWTASLGLWKVETEFGTDFTDCRGVDTSLGRDLTQGQALVEQRENIIHSLLRERSHGGGGRGSSDELADFDGRSTRMMSHDIPLSVM